MAHRFWATLFLLIHLFQGIIGTEDNWEFDIELYFPTRAYAEQSLNLDNLNQLPSTTALGQYSQPTEPVLQHRGALQLDLPAQSSAFYSVPNVLFGSTFHNDPETSARKRAKIQVPLTPLNYSPSSRVEAPTNAHSQPGEGPFVSSTNPTYPMDPIKHESGLVHPMTQFTTGVQSTQDHAAVPLTNQPFGSHQTVCTRKQNNLGQNVDHSDHPMRSSAAGRLGVDEKYTPETAKPFDKKDAEQGLQQTTKRQNTDVHETNGSRNAYSTSRPFPRDKVVFKRNDFNYFWIDFKSSTIDVQLVFELLGNVKLVDGTHFLNFAAGLTHAQELDDTIQNKFPQKMFCLDSFCNSNAIGFFNLFKATRHLRFPRMEVDERNMLRTKTRLRFRWNLNDSPTGSAHQPKILKYKKFVLSESKPLIENFEKKVDSDHKGDSNPQAMRILLKVKELLPIYLFYVDMISALLPVQPLDTASVLLKSQRKIARECFFELFLEALPNDKKCNLTNVDQGRGFPLIDKFKKGLQRSIDSRQQDFAVIWKVIEIWILTSRGNLAKIVGLQEINFKAFFNHLVWTWAGEDLKFGRMVCS